MFRETHNLSRSDAGPSGHSYRTNNERHWRVATGMNLKKALSMAPGLTCYVRYLRRTGEVVVGHLLLGRYVRINCRKKEAPRALTVLLRDACQLRLAALGR